MKIGILMLRYPPDFESPVITGVIRLLTQWGVKVDVVYPEEHLINLSRVRPEHDLYVLKSRTEMALVLAGALHAAGAAILNPYPVAAMLRDKVTTTRMLMAAGVPVPETVVTSKPEELTPLLHDGPLVIKPYRVHPAASAHIIWDAEELDDVPVNQGPILAQRYIERKGHVRKVYAVSGHVFGVEQMWPALTYEAKVGSPFTITADLRDIAHRCAELFGIEVFGLSIIGDGDAIYVVDLHSFPGFRGVPEASLRLADYVYHTCRRVMKGEPLLPAPRKEGDR